MKYPRYFLLLLAAQFFVAILGGYSAVKNSVGEELDFSIRFFGTWFKRCRGHWYGEHDWQAHRLFLFCGSPSCEDQQDFLFEYPAANSVYYPRVLIAFLERCGHVTLDNRNARLRLREGDLCIPLLTFGTHFQPTGGCMCRQCMVWIN